MPEANQIRDTCKLAPVDVHSLTRSGESRKHAIKINTQMRDHA